MSYGYAAIRLTEEENERLFAAWKRAEGVKNCSQFIKQAVNAYAGEEIFDLKRRIRRND